ncbi:helix-turn-helix transcriptional regulator [Streptomyces sp. NBC_00572]|uniref:helix-turn-helix domain-containing protein n=1 Tax=Streptomyces sp. NBC_00572 TaxID=2903664 RepID=UPI0022541F35|nr:helix-turn-helix transcriptional regulator [Streptomyces sp. NBC_00572]MCX4983091.1 helix-turn-helix domain-containing protein [Streptomyces sp. NBC_00572]
MAVGTGDTGSADANGGTGGTGGNCAGCEGCAATPWAELAAEMRRIKGATELSYGQLAQRTHYSRSSWERFLNQKQLPTRIAVEQFAAASGQDPRPLLIRLERSLAHGTATAAHTAATPRTPVGAVRASRPDRSVRPVRHDLGRPLGLVAAGALAGGLVTLLARAARTRLVG